MEVSGQLHALAALPPGNNPDTHWIGVWVGPKASLDVLQKSLLACWDWNPGLSNLYPVNIPTELPRPTLSLSVRVLLFLLLCMFLEVKYE